MTRTDQSPAPSARSGDRHDIIVGVERPRRSCLAPAAPIVALTVAGAAASRALAAVLQFRLLSTGRVLLIGWVVIAAQHIYPTPADQDTPAGPAQRRIRSANARDHRRFTVSAPMRRSGRQLTALHWLRAQVSGGPRCATWVKSTRPAGWPRAPGTRRSRRPLGSAVVVLWGASAAGFTSLTVAPASMIAHRGGRATCSDTRSIEN